MSWSLRLSHVGAHPLRASRRFVRPRLGAAAREFYEYLAFYAALAVFGIISLAWSLPAAVLYRLLPRRWGEPLGQFVIMAGFRGFLALMKIAGIIKCDLSALDALRPDGAIVIAPNHPSLLDAVLVISRLPRVACITKAKIWDNWFLGGGARLAGFIRNDAPVRVIKEAAGKLRDGDHLLIFPEGTRTGTAPVNDFKRGFALIARRAGVPVQAVFIDGSSPFLGKTWPLFKKPCLPLTYRIRLGRRFEMGGDVRAGVQEMEEYYRQELGRGEPPPGPA